jgi:hypothetical protein
MRRYHRALLALLLLNLAAMVFLAARKPAPPETELRRSADGRWVEVYHRRGELVAELQPADGAEYDVLAEVMTCRP